MTSCLGTKHKISRRARLGAMLILIVVMLVGFMVAIAFSVDVAQMHLARTELRSATDAASKAAATVLADTQDTDAAIIMGRRIARANTVAGEPLLLARRDFQFGRSAETNSGRFEFNPDAFPRNSVQVNGRRTADSPSGAVPLFFGNLLGVEFFEPYNRSTATYIERDVVLVVDRSGSMFGQKAVDLLGAIVTFTDTLNQTPVDERVGMSSYNHEARQDSQLTTVLSSIVDLVASMVFTGRTSISAGMEEGRQIMLRGRNRDFVERTMIVMTDGIHNSGVEPRETALVIAADGIRIHTITFGTGADIARMQEVAQIGGGRHFHADNGAQLAEVYREIALTLGTMITE